ncbi:MAG: hypothetical protein ACI83D_000474 [Planctomycetota bacterium]|jgi:hypothetical protein
MVIIFFQKQLEPYSPYILKSFGIFVFLYILFLLNTCAYFISEPSADILRNIHIGSLVLFSLFILIFLTNIINEDLEYGKDISNRMLASHIATFILLFLVFNIFNAPYAWSAEEVLWGPCIVGIILFFAIVFTTPW